MIDWMGIESRDSPRFDIEKFGIDNPLPRSILLCVALKKGRPRMRLTLTSLPAASDSAWIAFGCLVQKFNLEDMI